MKYVYESYTITQYNYLLDSQDGRPSRYEQSCQHYRMLCAHTYMCTCTYWATLASSPGSLIFFNARERKEGGGPGIQYHVINFGKLALRQACHKASISNLLGIFCRLSVRSSARPLRIVLPSRIVSDSGLLFHSNWAWARENRARPRTIFTIRHPSYPRIWAYVTHVTLDPRLPLFSLACIE
jgi:hypothetical protein